MIEFLVGLFVDLGELLLYVFGDKVFGRRNKKK